ncbi:MAG: FAD:protein FMN transferase, partial [Planctomycetota bacterium]
EISRFNASASTDWFPVSPETAQVVSFALEISETTGGAFDVTVGPLVNLWSFGPESRDRQLPSSDAISDAKRNVGYRHLHARLEPPAIRKDLPELEVDLSAIAKGHGVDRIVALLTSAGSSRAPVEDVFVEIGGEVRVTGSKGITQWKVGIQTPDSIAPSILAAVPLEDDAMATSGDYRNFFEVDGKRFSHTIDPITGSPVSHQLASATVIAPTCMAADAWATALTVLGPDRGRDLIAANNLNVLLVQRDDDDFTLTGTGLLEPFAVADVSNAGSTTFSQQLIPVALMTLVGITTILIAMAIGVIFGRRAISGSCGGLNNTQSSDGAKTGSCSLCSQPTEACSALRKQVEQASTPAGAGIE